MRTTTEPFVLRLPSLNRSTADLLKLADRTKDQFIIALASQLWDEEETLSDEVKMLIRDYIAASRFENSPVTQERRAEAREMMARNRA